MVVRIRGESGKANIDRAARTAIRVFVGLVRCHSFMWFVELGGSVIVE